MTSADHYKEAALAQFAQVQDAVREAGGSTELQQRISTLLTEATTNIHRAVDLGRSEGAERSLGLMDD
ncbi:MAG: hypothetical protein V1876_02925 [Candidatus Peregrinibacteria bacterium]